MHKPCNLRPQLFANRDVQYRVWTAKGKMQPLVFMREAPYLGTPACEPFSYMSNPPEFIYPPHLSTPPDMTRGVRQQASEASSSSAPTDPSTSHTAAANALIDARVVDRVYAHCRHTIRYSAPTSSRLVKLTSSKPSSSLVTAAVRSLACKQLAYHPI